MAGHDEDRAATRYFSAAAIVMAMCFGAVWLWAAAMPLAYLDPEYPVWLAKQQMLGDCTLGDVLLLGDSRAAVDVLPSLLPVPLANLAVGGGEPIEAYIALTRALACPAQPRRVVISFDAVHFTEPDLFWERSVRFGFIGLPDLTALRQASQETRDASFATPKIPDGLPAALRGWLYAARFPPLYFSSLARAVLIRRLWHNRETFTATLAARGQSYFGLDAGSAIVAAEGHLGVFTPLPVLDRYFDRMLSALAARGIPVDFVAMPMNQATARMIQPAVRDGFAAYLARYEARYANFHVVGSVMPDWPDRYFGDGFSHLNPQGAQLLSAYFGRCLEGRLKVDSTRPDCDLPPAP